MPPRTAIAFSAIGDRPASLAVADAFADGAQLVPKVTLVNPSGSAWPVKAAETVILPFRQEQWKQVTTSSAGANIGKPTAEWTSSDVYDSNLMAGGSELPLAVTVNATTIGATMYGTVVEGYFFGSLFGLVRCIGNSSAVLPSHPCTVVIDGVAFQLDARTPWLDYPVSAALDNNLTFQKTLVARGLHGGRHHVVLQFPMAADGVTNRYWRFEGFEVERTATQQPPPPVEIPNDTQQLAISNASGSPTQIGVRNQTGPSVLGISQIYFSNTTNAAIQLYHRMYNPNGYGASASYTVETIPAYSRITVAPAPGNMWVHELQAYASATGVIARAFYKR